MKLYGAYADTEALDERVIQGYLSRRSNNLGMAIYNYTAACAYDHAWDDHTMQARGLIVKSSTGRILARPLPKFFNYDQVDNIPRYEAFTVHEKLDGSMFILSTYGVHTICATRGAFDSEQAKIGVSLMQRIEPWTIHLYPDCTYIFEIIHPQTKVVVSYDYSDLVLLAIIETSTGREIDMTDQRYGPWPSVRIAKQIPGPYLLDTVRLKNLIPDNQEGWVIRFESGMRIKVKSDEYMRLHRLVTQLSSKAIWEHIKLGLPIAALLERTPDEFNNFVHAVEGSISLRRAHLKKQIESMYNQTCAFQCADPRESRKRKAAFLARQDIEPAVRAGVFAMLDNKPYEDIVWRACEPKFLAPPFAQEATA